MGRPGSIALAAAVAGAALGCTEPEGAEGLACNFRVGPRGDGMPDLEMLAGDTARSPLADHFGPVGCLELLEYHDGDLARAFLAGSSDPAAVAVSVSGSDLETVAAAAADSVRVTVRLSSLYDWGNADGRPFHDPHEFLVRVRPRP